MFYDEFKITYDEGWLSQKLRIFHRDSRITLSWLAGPIPVDDFVGKEVIARMCLDINNGGVFYTDSNGRQLVERRLDERPTYTLDNATEPVAQNYHPVTAMIAVRDAAAELAVLPDRAQGGASLAEGCVELMVHRRLLFDDWFGVGEPLNEVAYGTGLVAAGSNKFALLWGEAQKKIAYSYPRVTYSYPKVA